MIYLYTGTPGSGKSLHSARDIYQKLKNGGNVIANFPVNVEKIKNLKGEFYYIDNADITVDFFIRFADKYHEMGKENQTLVILDECSVLFNPRDFQRSDRSVWLSFFAQHRKYGFNFILVSQMDRQIDRQIRGCVEVEVKHRKANNYKMFWILPFPLFLAIDTWYAGGGGDNKLNSFFFLYRKKYGADFYNSFMLFDGRLKVKNTEKIDKLIKEGRLTNGGDSDGGDPLTAAQNLKEQTI